jgi:hypothetical protein
MDSSEEEFRFPERNYQGGSKSCMTAVYFTFPHHARSDFHQATIWVVPKVTCRKTPCLSSSVEIVVDQLAALFAVMQARTRPLMLVFAKTFQP